MRALFTVMPAVSHLRPALPLARELRERGWDVAIAASASMRDAVSDAGFPLLPVGLDWSEPEAERTFPELVGMPLAEQAYRWVSDIFADRAARPTATDLIALIPEWEPDLVVRDYWDFGAWAAVEATGVPAAVVGLAMFAPPEELRGFVGPQLQALRAHAGLDPDEPLGSLYAGPYIDLLPVTYQAAAPPNAVRMRPVAAGGNEPAAPTWLSSLPDRPTLLVTFGTVFNRVPGVFETVIEALADEPVNVIVTTGHGRDPAGLGPLPANTRAERFLPHAAILPGCDAVICHAGFGTTMAALAHDLPVVAVPLSADQPIHAERCRALGVGTVVAQADLTAGAVRSAVRRAVSDPRLRSAAAALGAEIRDMPGPGPAADALEREVLRVR